ncbi:hypothetical protein PACTADRAFT_80216 [Pachysolen tannophilus NRRL Y-2460]|uniref:Chromatin modification-related protein EAF6 n=1 Tax=Pachysolen tannophilus NRRL Y-2460 TaxID=669874 RepID=A0A1E4TWM5_PACTA|nr:hypothetical protein PACTADRAFT_80216 [Pachysolen tannophilus NRRL Y-2460]
MPSETSSNDLALTAEYEKLKKQLHHQIVNKRNLDRELTMLEEEIFNKETAYLSQGAYGNIIKGFTNFPKTSGSSNSRKKFSFTDDDRIFSLSSSTYVRHLKKINENGGNAENSSNVNFEELAEEDIDITPNSGKKKKKINEE